MNHLKVLDELTTDNELIIEGYLALYGGQDLTGEFFTKSTQFESEYTKQNVVLIDWEHGFQPDGPESPDEDDVLGRVNWKTAKSDDTGLLVQRILDRRNRYVREIVEPLARAEMLGSSSEAVPKGVRKSESGEIQIWPVKRDSFTVNPAEPKLLTDYQMRVIKSLADKVPALKSLLPQGAEEGAAKDIQGQDSDNNPIENNEVKTMAENVNVITRDEFERFADDMKAELAEVKGLGGKLDAVLNRLENTPAAKKGGFVAPDSEADAPQTKSFADFLLAVRNGNSKRLREVYQAQKSSTQKDLGTTDGSAGGFLVPAEYSATIIETAVEQSPILGLVETVPVGMMASGSYPALDNYITPTAGSGQTAMAAGLSSASRAEGTTMTEDEPQFIELDWRVREHGGYTEVNNELPRFSPVAIERLLTRLFGISIAAKKEMMIFRGNGVTQYLGILNSPAAIGISPDTNSLFAYADMLEIWSRFKAVSGAGRIRWAIHPGLITDIGQFEIGTNGAGVPTQVGTPGIVNTMPGTPYGIVYSEHLPQADTSGCAILADFGSYAIFQSGTLEVAFSEHAAFTSNKGTWRWLDYSDGMPWVKNYITLADPTGSYTVSPFVYFND